MRRKHTLRSLVAATVLLLSVAAVGARAQEPTAESTRAAPPVARPLVYLMGQVSYPAARVLRRQTRLTEMLDCCSGGILPGGDKNMVRVYRTGPGENEPERIDIDLKAVRKGRAADLVLLPYDIIEVPRKNNHLDCELMRTFQRRVIY